MKQTKKRKRKRVDLICTRVKTMRTKEGITQEALAEKCGYENSSSISNIERKKRNDISIGEVERLAKTLNVSFSYLVGLTDNPDSESIDTFKAASKYIKIKRTGRIARRMTSIDKFEMDILYLEPSFEEYLLNTKVKDADLSKMKSYEMHPCGEMIVFEEPEAVSAKKERNDLLKSAEKQMEETQHLLNESRERDILNRPTIQSFPHGL